ncbi:tRNA 5-methoxyuridine(34)/uridine 5-oxyacetic acid(34) synthase CmoB, partial [Salmonella enterica subsp. enterica serovar Kentucky]|nr:tRNA 5-methoxyuridine(34)/uridine 5-oxyacetic acid(34) synthase CmoB [Salmonella enterica subsp. enterica serovar Kentucky]
MARKNERIIVEVDGDTTGLQKKLSVTAESETPLSEGQLKRIDTLLRNLMPWRKGPFSLYGVDIDT